MRLQLTVNTCKCCLKNQSVLSENQLQKLFKKLTYTNKSVSYQILRLKKQKQKMQSALSSAAGGSDSHEKIKAFIGKIEEDIQKLTLQMKPCLLQEKEDGSLEFPGGLFDRVAGQIREFGLDLDIEDTRSKPQVLLPFPRLAPEPALRPYQVEGKSILLDRGQGTEEAATGTGKTVEIQEIVRELGLNTVIVVPKTQLMWQTYDRFRAYFGDRYVGCFGDGTKKIKPITVAVIDSLSDSDPSLWKDVQVLVLDEAHHVAAPTLQKVCFDVLPHCYYRFGFTATPERSDGADLAVEGAAYPVVHRYSVQDGIREGYLANPQFLMLVVSETAGKYHGSDILTAYHHHVMRNSRFNNILRHRIESLIPSGKKMVTLVREREHGHLIHSWDPEAIFVRNKESKEDQKKMEKRISHLAPYEDPARMVNQFNSGNIRHLIGTSIIGEGTDLIPVEVLNMLTMGASRGPIMQNIGRALRTGAAGPFEGKKSVLVIDYIFDIHKLLLQHSLKRKAIYESIGHVTVLPIRG